MAGSVRCSVVQQQLSKRSERRTFGTHPQSQSDKGNQIFQIRIAPPWRVRGFAHNNDHAEQNRNVILGSFSTLVGCFHMNFSIGAYLQRESWTFTSILNDSNGRSNQSRSTATACENRCKKLVSEQVYLKCRQN